MGVNKWIGVGNLGKDPEIKFLNNGNAVCNFSLACNEQWKDKDGEKQQRVEWVRVVAWGKLAENAAQYLGKGRQCYVEGKLQTRKWADQDGVERWTTEVVARDIVFIGKGSGGGGDRPPEPPELTEDDMPV